MKPLCLGFASVLLTTLALEDRKLGAAPVYWDVNGATAGSGASGSSFVWNGTNLLWNNAAGNGAPAAWVAGDVAVFSAGADGTGSYVVTVTGTQVAGGLTFEDGFAWLTGGTVELGPGFVLHGLRKADATVESLLTGGGGLTKTGGGVIRLANASNNYLGLTSITNGTLIISHQGQLGADTSAVVVTGSTTRGFGGGALLLESSYGSTLSFTRGLTIQGYGPITDRSSALMSVGDVNLSGPILYGAGNVATSITSAGGTLTISGSLTAQGTGTLRMGTINSLGVGSYHLTGALTGTGSLEKLGAGTLIMDSVNASSFSGTILLNGGTVRVSQGASLGTSQANGALTLGNATAAGTLEIRTGAADSFATRRVQMGVNSSAVILVDHEIGSSTLNQVVRLGPLTLTAGSSTRTLTISGRNGYGLTFGGASVGGALGGNNTISVTANGLVTNDGDFWNNTSTTARTLTMTIGTGSKMVIDGSLVASGAAHILSKTGAGTLTILGGDSTFTGATSITGGTLEISHWGSINNNTAAVTLGTTTTAAVLSIIGNDLTAGQATTSKVITLAGTTGGGSILANQTGASAGVLILSDILVSGAGAKSLTLGGRNSADNTIAGVIADSGGINITLLRKTDAGTWMLTGANTFTGPTQISNGVLKIQDTFTGTSRNVLNDSSAIGFVADVAGVGSAGGVFQYLGADGSASTETVGPLMAAAGAGTVNVTAGAGGSATLTFSSFGASVNVTDNTTTTTITVDSTAGLAVGMRLNGGTAAATISSITNGTQIVVSAAQTVSTGMVLTFDRPNGGGTVNLNPDANSSVVITSVANAGLLGSYTYFRGADFAYAPTTSNAVIRAPIYGLDSTFVVASSSLIGSNHNLVLGNTSTGTTLVGSLKIDGSHTVTQTGALTIRTGSAGTTGGILVTGGSATINGAGGVTTNGAADLIIRVNGASDVLNLNTPVLSTTTGGLTKTGEGTLILSAQNAHTGITSLNEGTIQLATGGRLSANTVNFTMRQGTVFDMNGVSVQQTSITSSVGVFNGTGTVTNTSSDAVIFAIAGSGGTFNGSINEVNGRISVVKMGTTSTQVFNGLSNYTGSTTIGVAGNGTTGTLSVFYLADIGQDSSIGRGDGATLATNQGSLIFGGTTGGLIYVGDASVSTNRLFTLAGTDGSTAGVTITNNGINNATLIFSNEGPIAFASSVKQAVRLAGTSLGDNLFNPQITDNGSAITSVSKSGAGLWILGNSDNTYTGTTTITDGHLQAQDGEGLSSDSGLILGGTTSTITVFQSSGLFTRNLSTVTGAGQNTVSWNTTLSTGGAGFAASTDKLVVAIGGVSAPTELIWGTGGFINAGASLVLNSTTALSEVEIRNGINLNGANRTIVVNDNTTTQTDYATITGVISNSTGTAGITKTGNGVLQLLGLNTYNGITAVTAGTLVVNSLGNSTAGGGSSLGTSSNAQASALTLGNGGTTAGVLQYVGAGETSDRMIRINTTTGSTQIHADGSGALVLTNVLNDMSAGLKTLFLRGSNTMNNVISSNLDNNGGNLAITVDGGAAWVLSGNNGFSGTVTVSSGAFGVGSNTAAGTGIIQISSGSVFAYGGDRTLGNTIQHSNNTTTAFIGDYSLTLNGVYVSQAGANNIGTTNNMAADAFLTLNAGATFNSMTATRAWTINGSGNTVINGNITTTTAFSVNVGYSGTGTLTLNGSNTTGGTTTISGTGGTVIVGNNDAFGSGTLSVTAGGLRGDGTARVIGNNVTHGGTFILGGDSDLTFNGRWLNSGGSRTLTVNNTAATILAGEVALSESATTARTLTINGTGDVLISGAVTNGTGTGASALAYTGSGTLTLTSGANTYTGTTTLNNTTGTLVLSGAAVLSTGNLTVNAGTLLIESVDQSVATLTTGGAAVGSQSIIDIGAGLTLSVTAITHSATNNNLTAVIGGDGTLDLGAGGITVTVNNSSTVEVDMSWEMDTVIGSGLFTKAGTGTLDIRGVTNYNFTGTYQINAGAILGLDDGGANLALNGGVWEGSGSFTRPLGTGAGQVQWVGTGGGGFAASGGNLTVTLGGAPDPLVWGVTPSFVADGAPLIFGSTTADSVVDFTHNIDLNAAARTVSVVDNTALTTDKARLSGVLSNGGLTKTGNGVLELTGLNTFTGVVTVTQGTLQFTTVNSNGGGPSNLGQGTDSITLNGGTLSFIGDGAGASQTTNRNISITATSTLAANGTNGAVITYTGVITHTGNNTLNLSGTGEGRFQGNIGTSSDIQVISGTWVFSGNTVTIADDFLLNGGTTTLQNMTLSVGDDIVVTGATAVLNLDSTGVWTPTSAAGTSSGLFARGGGVINFNAHDVNGVNNANGVEYILLGDSTTLGTGTLNTNIYNVTVPRLDLGAIAEGYDGVVTGSGTITGTYTGTDYGQGFRLFRGSIEANLAGGTTILKQGLGDVTLSGDNSGLTGAVNAPTRVDSGNLILDYTAHNTLKIPSNRALDLRGGTVTVLGNGSAATDMTVLSTTLASGGASSVVVTSNGFATTVNLGAITRANSAGTMRFVLPALGAITTTTTNHAGTGMLGATGVAYATVTTGAGTFFAANDGANNIVALTYGGAKNDVTTWTAGENVTDDTTGYTGTLASGGSINSLRFDAAGPSTVTIGAGQTLTISSGGILQTSNVTAGVSTITGGGIASGSGELVITVDSVTQAMHLSSDILGTPALTKTGNGELTLSGRSTVMANVQLQNGILKLEGGNALGDRAAVTLADDHIATLQLLANEKFGTLAGGSATTGLDTLATVEMGGYTLTLDQWASTTYAGKITGTGSLIKTGAGTLALSGASTGFTGNLIVNQGQLTLATRTIANMTNAASLTLNSGTLVLDFNSGTESSPNKLSNTAPIYMINTGGIDGLRANNDRNDASKAETVGAVNFLGGANTITASASSTSGTTQRNMTITLTSLVRTNRSTLLLRGQNLGTTSTGSGLSPIHTGRIVATTVPTLTGGGGAAGTKTISILPWAIGSSSITGTGESFVTHAATTGFRPLDLVNEYEQLVADGGITSNQNVRYSGTAGLTLDGTNKTMNALLVDNTSTSAGITLNGAGGTLEVVSGAYLFTGTQGITLQDFSGITVGALNEYILHVVNTSADGVTVNAPFTSEGANLTKSGAGTLILAGTGSTYTGITTVNQGVLQIDSLNKLGNNGSGGLLLNAGTVRFGAAFDLSQTRVLLGSPTSATVTASTGGTLDTNGFDVVLSESIGGGGSGGLTKAGAGTLTLNAAADYRGDTTLAAGTLAFGVAGAVPSGTNLNFTGGTLDTGAFDAAFGGVTLAGNGTLNGVGSRTITGDVVNQGGNRILTFTGNGTTTFDGNVIVLTESTTARTLTFAVNAGSVVVNSVLSNGASTGSAFTKTGAGTLELTSTSSYTGTTTIGSSTLEGGTVLLTGAGKLGTGNLTLVTGVLDIQSVNQNVATLTMGGGAAGSSATIEIGAGLTLTATAITYSATNNNQTAVIGGDGTLNLGTNGITVTVNNSTLVDVDMSWEMDTVIGSGLFTKAGAGTLDIRGVTNYNFTGSYQINAGAILGLDGLNNNIVLNGGVYEGSGTFTRSLGTGNDQVQWVGTGGGGFSAAGGDLTVTLSLAPDPLVWGVTPFFVADGAPLIFGSATADSVVDFTHNIDLNGAARTVNVVNNTLSTGDKARLSGVLSNGGLTKTGNGILELAGANTFTGGIIINGSGGTVQFSNAANLNGNAISLQAGILSYIGSTNLTLNNAININPGTAGQTVGLQNLSADGTSGAVIDFSGTITTGANILTLIGTGTGRISGSIVQTGTAADVYVNAGTWTISGAANAHTLADDLVVQNAGTVLNLDSTGSIQHTAGTSNGLYGRSGSMINLLANDPFSTTLDFILLGDTTGPLAGTLNLNNFNLTTLRLDLGQAGAGLEGVVLGTGTLTVNTTLSLFRGRVEANLVSAATAAKSGTGEVIFQGDNSGLTGATTLNNGILRLNYTASNTRKIGSGLLTVAGGTLIVDGSTAGDTVETVNGLTISGGTSSGASAIYVNNGAGRLATLNLGAITRTTAGGTVDFGTSSSSDAFITTSTTNPANMTSLGGWATFNKTSFATVAGGNIVAVTAVAKDDVATWAAGDNVTDAGGYTGTLATSSVNSIVFNAAAGSDLLLGSSAVLTINNGGILVTENAGEGGISGGFIASGLPVGASAVNKELVVHQHSANRFTISSTVNGQLSLTKTGTGTLLLDGNNLYSGGTSVTGGTLQVAGGNGIGDRSIVFLRNAAGVVLDLTNSSETIAGLNGGGADGGVVNLGTGTLHILNNSGSTTVFLGRIEGSGTLIKSGVTTQELEGSSVNFTGNVVVNGGLLHLDSTSGSINQASTITINAGGELLTDQEQSGSIDRIGNNTTVTLNNTIVARGLWLRNENQNANRADTIGKVILGSGHNVIQATLNTSSTTTDTARVGTMTITSFERDGHATALVRGQALGSGTGNRGRIAPATLPLGAVGGNGLAGSSTITIIPYLIGAAGVDDLETDANVALLVGNSFVTWVSAAEGFRPLNLDSEYELNEAEYNLLTGVTSANVRFAANPAALLTGGSKTINSLVLDSGAEALTIAGDAADILTLASGALLATTTTPANTATLEGFAELRTGTNEYLVYVTNAGGTLTINSALTSAAALTKSGAGLLVLGNAANSYDGGTWFNQGLIQVSTLSALGSGGLNFHGGGLRWAAGTDFDVSTRPVTFGIGGGTFDTNGNNVILANSIGGGGAGGLTKTGEGTLTLNAVIDFSGSVTVAGGATSTSALIQGVAGALLPTTDLVLGNATVGGYFDHGSFQTTLHSLNVNINSVIAGGADLTFTGNVEFHGSGSRTLTINNTGTTVFDGDVFSITDRGTTARTATIAGTGNTTINSRIVDGTAGGSALNITNTGTTRLNGYNTYTGATTINAGVGTVIINSSQALGSGTALTLASGTLMGDGSGTKVISQNVTNSGIITIGGTDQFVFNGTWTTSGGTRTLAADTTGGVVLNGNVILGETTNNRAQVFGGSGAITVNGVIQNNTGAAAPAGAIVIAGTSTGTVTMNAANIYTGTTSINSGTLEAGVDQNMTGALQFGSASSTATAGTLDLSSASWTTASLLAQTNSATEVSKVIIGAGESLTVNGNVMLGSSGATTTTLFEASGDGAFIVNNTVNTGNTFQVANSNTNISVADFSDLAQMSVSLNTAGGIFQVSSASGTNSTAAGTLILAKETAVTAFAITVGGGGSYNGGADQVNSLQLGTGVNTLHTGALNIGTGARDIGSVTFHDASDGTLVLRGANGTDAVAFNMGTGIATTGVAGSPTNRNVFDVTGHDADLLFSAVTIGTQNRNSNLYNYFAFDEGTLVMSSLVMSSKGSNGSTTSSTMDLGGGDVTIGTGSGSAITLAANTGPGVSEATINITGGTVSVEGNIVRGTKSGTGTSTATVTLDGGVLDMNGHNIGATGANGLVNFNAYSGTLKDVEQINGGATLIKSTSGVLVLEGTNNYTGITLVNDGVLQVGSNGSGTTGTANVIVNASTATLAGTGTVRGAVEFNAGSIRPGDDGGADIGTLTLNGPITMNGGTMVFDIASETTNDAAAINQAIEDGNLAAYLASMKDDYDALLTTTGHDSLVGLTGTLNLSSSGAIEVIPAGYTPQFGDVFDILDWTNIVVGTFDVGGLYRTGGTVGDLTLPDLEAGLEYYTGLFDGTNGGIIVVVGQMVPEPGRVMLLVMGAACLLMRRRRMR